MYRDLDKKRACAKRARANYRAAHPERVKAQNRASQLRRNERDRELTRLNHANPEYLQKQADKKKRSRLKDQLRESNWTIEQYDTAMAEQGEFCAICGKKPEPRPGNPYGRLCADHDHLTGLPRQLLCHGCNGALGLFQDSPSLCEKGAAYLRKHGK